MKIFITGASGFAGGAIAARLVQAGHAVSGMARSQKSIDKLQSLGITPVSCELDNIEAKHLTGVDVVVHCAAYVEEWGSEADYYNANVVGTQKVLDASKAAGVGRFIHIGTEAAFYKGQDMIKIDELASYAETSPYPYSRTKAEAEKRVLAANCQTGMLTLSIRPRFIWGPGDKTVLPTIIQMIQGGKFAWIGGGEFQTSTTHVTNLAHAVELALVKGSGGQAYFVSDDSVEMMRDFVTRYVRTQGVEAPNKTIPRAVARFAARVIEPTWKLLFKGSKPPLVRFTVDMLSSNVTVSIEKARKELGYTPVMTVDEGMRTMPRLTS